MSLDFRIVELSATAGSASDGVVRGAVSQSLLVSALSTVVLAANVYAIRKDVNSGTSFFTDVSTLAVSDTLNAFQPWGSVATMTLGDGLLVACDSDVRELYVNVSTAGAGVWDGLEVLDSTDGRTFNRVLTGVTDGSNGFRNAGISRITMPDSFTHSTLSPVPGDITDRKWLLIRPKNFVSVTTAPAIRRVWIAHHAAAITYAAFTMVANGVLTDASFGSPTDSFFTVGAEIVYCLPFLAYGLDHTIHRRVSNAADYAHEYLATDGTWKALPDFVDPSNDFENGPASLGAAIQSFAVRWTIPSDWTTKTVNFSGIGNVTGYFVRYRVTAVNTLGPITPALVRTRVRAFGPSNSRGITQRTARTYRSITLGDAGVPPTQPLTVQFVNINNGKMTRFPIPANPTLPLSLTLSPELIFIANEQLLISCVGTGQVLDVELILEE